MHIPVFVLLLTITGIFTSAHAANPEYRCEPGTVADDAVAVAYTNVDVSTFSDPDNDVCTFAIDGASKRGPSSSTNVSPIAQILNQVRSGNVEQLVLRLTLARSNSQEVDRRLRRAMAAAFSKHIDSIDTCITALEKFDSGPPDPVETSESDALIYLRAENDTVYVECSVLKPGETPVLKSPLPTLRFYSRSEGAADTLFVPSPALE